MAAIPPRTSFCLFYVPRQECICESSCEACTAWEKDKWRRWKVKCMAMQSKMHKLA